MYKLLKDAPIFENTRVLARLTLNVPIQDGRVGDDYRIKTVLQTLAFLHERGAKTILVSHIEAKHSHTLTPVFNYLKNYFPVSFDARPLGEVFTLPPECAAGEFVLLENIRRDPREKANDEEFVKKLASLGEIFVNEDFPAAHRAHASIAGVPKFIPAFAGLRFDEEVRMLSRAFDPARPFVFLIGGAKFETKLPLVRKFLSRADRLFVGGALANDCFRAQGVAIGRSSVSAEAINIEDIVQSPLVVLPADVVVREGGETALKKVGDIGREESVVDVGPYTLEEIRRLLIGVRFVLWNGPLGLYEEGYKDGTLKLAELIAESGAEAIVGGGDTIAAIAELNLSNKFTFVSTAGGAMLDFLATGTLPGIEALITGIKKF